MIYPFDNRSLYNSYDFFTSAVHPFSEYNLSLSKQFIRIADNLNLPIKFPIDNLPFANIQNEWSTSLTELTIKFFRQLGGYYYFYHLITQIYAKPEFNIYDTQIGDDYIDIVPECVDRKSFCDLIQFRKKGVAENTFPKMLLVAPLSGHHSTLLRDTVKALLPFYDIYITDWKNARDVPLTEGSFDLDDCIDYILSYFKLLGPELNVMAVCQPTLPVLAAIALMSTEKDPRLPQCAILLGGPIDTSKSPTTVDELAMSRDGNWFEETVISMVPSRFPGAMRLVYPGFMQLSGFLSMNIQRHLNSIQEAIENYADNKREAAFKTLRFYLEYFSTMDLPAEFYMQTIHTVFQKQLITKGRYQSKGRDIKLKDIKDTAIFAIEGERDDITGIGQTKSVINLCRNLPNEKKRYFLAPNVGHYGLFNGHQFRNIIIPEMNHFIDLQKELKKGKKL